MTPRQLGHLLSMTSGGVTASEWGRGLEPFNGARGLSPG